MKCPAKGDIHMNISLHHIKFFFVVQYMGLVSCILLLYVYSANISSVFMDTFTFIH